MSRLCLSLLLALGACSLPMSTDQVQAAQAAPATKAPNASRFGEGLYVGVRHMRGSLGGDLDGESALVGPSDLIVLPAFTDASGIGLALGGQGNGASGEIYYESVDHPGSFLGFSTEGTLRSCGFRGRVGKPTSWSGPYVAPHVLLGLGVHDLQIRDGSTNGVDVGNAELSGLGIDLGLGASVALHPRLTFSADYFWRCIFFTSASGLEASDLPLADNIESFEPVLMFGLDLVF